MILIPSRYSITKKFLLATNIFGPTFTVFTNFSRIASFLISFLGESVLLIFSATCLLPFFAKTTTPTYPFPKIARFPSVVGPVNEIDFIFNFSNSLILDLI